MDTQENIAQMVLWVYQWVEDRLILLVGRRQNRFTSGSKIDLFYQWVEDKLDLLVGQRQIRLTRDQRQIKFTSGSKIEEKVGSDFIVFIESSVFHKWFTRLEIHSSAFQVEVHAIQKTLQWLQIFILNNMQIRVNSRPAL